MSNEVVKSPEILRSHVWIWAILLSVLVHLCLIGGVPDWLPDEEAEDGPLHIELQPLPAPDLPKAIPKVKVKSLKPKPVESAPSLVNTMPAPAPAETSSVATHDEGIADANTQPVTVSEDKPVVVSEPVPVDPPEPAAAIADASEVIVDPPPQRVELDFDATRGKDDGVVAVDHHEYQAQADGRYQLTSSVSPKGLVSMFFSELNQKSDGLITDQGLQPEHFFYQYGKKANKARQANFDWDAGKLKMRVGESEESADLIIGTQDIMSFMYQFMFVPPLQHMHVAVTTGAKLRMYDYTFEGEETIKTKAGSLLTTHIVKTGAGEEKSELWLANEYHYLPVKIRQTDKDGTVTERVLTRMIIDAQTKLSQKN